MENWVIAITCTYPHEAHMIESYLSSHGIETYLKDEMTVQANIAYSNAIGGVKILVSESDYEQSVFNLPQHRSLSQFSSFSQEVEADFINKITY
jgi:hypothetical protein